MLTTISWTLIIMAACCSWNVASGSASMCSDWTDFTSCPAPTTALSDGVKNLKAELTKMKCTVPPEFFAMGTDSVMIEARSGLKDYKKKMNITKTMVRAPKLIKAKAAAGKTSGSMGSQGSSASQGSNSAKTAKATAAAGRKKRQAVSNNGTTPPPPPPIMNGTTPRAMNGTTSMPMNGTTKPPPPPAVINGTAATPPPAGNGTKPPTAPPPPAKATGQPTAKVLHHRLLALRDRCYRKMAKNGQMIDDASSAMVERIAGTLLQMYDSSAPSSQPDNIKDLFLTANPGLMDVMQRAAKLNAVQMAAFKNNTAMWKSNMLNMLDTYFNVALYVLNNMNSTVDATKLKQFTTDFAKYANDAADYWGRAMTSLNITSSPGLSLPTIAGDTPAESFLQSTSDPCYIMSSVCKLVDEGLLDYAVSFSETELAGLPKDEDTGAALTDFADDPLPDDPVVGCGFCFRKIRCCQSKPYSNFLEQQDVDSDICDDHSAACEVPPMADGTCNYAAKLSTLDVGKPLKLNSSINTKFYATFVQEQNDRMNVLLGSSGPAMNCTKVDGLCYCCCGVYEPKKDYDGYMICQLYQPPPPTTKPPVTTAPLTTPKPANATLAPVAGNATVAAGNATVAAGNSTTKAPVAGNVTAAAGNATVAGGNSTTKAPVAGNTTSATGNTTAVAGKATVAGGNSTTKAPVAGNTTSATGNTTAAAGNATAVAGKATVAGGNSTTKAPVATVKAAQGTVNNVPTVIPITVKPNGGKMSGNDESASGDTGGGCFGSFAYPAQCSDNNCEYWLSWKSLRSPRALLFNVAAKVKGSFGTGVGFGSNQQQPESIAVAYLKNNQPKLFEGIMSNDGRVASGKGSTIQNITMNYVDPFLQFSFVKTCSSLGVDYCDTSLFYFTSNAKRAAAGKFDSIDFSDLTKIGDIFSDPIVNGPLLLKNCF